MAEYYRHEVKVGCFLVLAVAIGSAFLLWISGGTQVVEALFRHRTEYRVRFTDTTGIKIGSSVRLSGAMVGEVAALYRVGTMM